MSGRALMNGIELPQVGATVYVTFTDGGDAWVHLTLDKGAGRGASDGLPEVIDFRVDHVGKHAGDHDPISPETMHIAVRLAKV